MFVKKDKKRSKPTPAENLFALKEKNLILESKLILKKIEYKNLQKRLMKSYIRESKFKIDQFDTKLTLFIFQEIAALILEVMANKQIRTIQKIDFYVKYKKLK